MGEPLNPQLVLHTSGVMLYGDRYHSALARDMSCTRRTIANWLERAPPPEHPMWAKLDKLMQERVFDIQEQRGQVARAAATA